MNRAETLGMLAVLSCAIGCAEAAEPGGSRARTGPVLQDDGGNPSETTPQASDAGAANPGWNLPAVDGGSRDQEACDTVLQATIRDFTEDHPDFESYLGLSVTTGLVEKELGEDGKPVYAHPGGTSVTTGPDEFAQWYNDVEGVNIPIEVTIEFTETASGTLVYDDPAFFPIDNQGFGNGPRGLFDGILGTGDHNYLFTTEIHTAFTYEGGEQFTFRGDDDLWVFVNGRLAMDLGGVHPAAEATIDMDARAAELGIQVGETYPMAIFHAERRTPESNFRIETSIRCFLDTIIR